jgi:aspartate oxidase
MEKQKFYEHSKAQSTYIRINTKKIYHITSNKHQSHQQSKYYTISICSKRIASVAKLRRESTTTHCFNSRPDQERSQNVKAV